MIKLDPIDIREAARYMGVRGEPDSNTLALIEKCEEEVRRRVRPNYVYRESEIDTSGEDVFLKDAGLHLKGEDIRRHLSGCRKAVIFAATLSSEADKLIRQTAVTDVAAALAVDCLCSAAIEQVCDKAEEEIFSEVAAEYRTWRFSPGYGDLPIEVQGDFLRSLNAQRRIGLTVTDSCLLLPTKSVTAIIGVSDVPMHKTTDSGCDSCGMREHCAFSKKGGCSN